MANKIKINKKRWLSNKPSSYAIEQLEYMGIDDSVNRVNEKLRNVRGMSEFSYISIDEKIREANDLLKSLCNYVDGTLQDINDVIDEPFFKRFDNKTGILEKFERINLDDYKTKNILDIQEHGTTQLYDYKSGTYKPQSYSYTKENIGLKDLLNNLEVKGFQGMPSFTEMMQGQYKKELENAEFDLSFDDYVKEVLHRSDIQHTVDRGWLNLASDVLDIVGIVSAIALFTGNDIITGEILTDAEHDAALFNTVINVGVLVTTLATAGAGSILGIGTKLGWKETGKLAAQVLKVDMISGVSGMATINLLDAAGAPEQLSAIVGLGVSFFGGYQVGTKAKIDDLVTQTGLTATQLNDIMKYTGNNLDDFAFIVKRGGLESLLGIPNMHLNYLVEQSGKSADGIAAWLKNNEINLNTINANNLDEIIKGASGAGKIERPSWRQSELDAAKDFPDYSPQKSFKKMPYGTIQEVSYGTKGSVRPDYYKTDHSVDIKNYDVTTSSGRSSLKNNISKQYNQRLEAVPSGTKQTVVIDIRGQSVTDSVLDSLYNDIMKSTNSGIEIRFKITN